MLQLRKTQIVLIQMTFSPYHEAVLVVTSTCGRSSLWLKNSSSHFGKIIPFRKTQNLNCRCACRQCSVNREMFLLVINILNHILEFFTEGFENLPPSFFGSENLLSNIDQCTRLHLYFPFGKFHSDIHNKMADNNGTALRHETDFGISKNRFY